MRLYDIGEKDGPPVVTDRVLTIPNLLSFLRIAVIPLVYLDLVAGRHLRALVLLAVLASTDWLDGYLARRLDQTSRLGIHLDPISDRVLFVVAGAGLVVSGLLPLWAVLVVVVRDLAVLGAGAVLIARGAEPPPASRVGKSATFGLLAALPVFLVASILGAGPAQPQPVAHTIAWAVLAVSVVLHWVSAFGYGRTVLRRRSDPDLR